MLSGLGDDLESYGIGAMKNQETRVVRRKMNWKLVSDTFWEAVPHQGAAREKHGADVREEPRDVRRVRPQPSLRRRAQVGREAARPAEAKWDLVPHATILMNLFPNTILVMQSDHAEVYRSCPRSFLPSRCSGRQDDISALAQRAILFKF